MPSFLNSGGGALYARFPEGRQTDVTESLSLQENLTMVRGRHTFKTGYELLRTRANSLLNAQPSGRFYFGGTEMPFTPNTGNAVRVVPAGRGCARRFHQGLRHLAA